jgi:hypothetical protein
VSVAPLPDRAAVVQAIRQPGTRPGDDGECRRCKRDTCGGDCPDGGRRDFRRVDEGHYRFALPDLGVEFVVDRLRRKSDELVGELMVRSSLPGARTFEGVLAVADLNLSSLRAREDRARFLAKRSRAAEIDWTGLLEEFVHRVLASERAGQPAVLLRDVPRPKPDETRYVDGWPLLARHAQFLFGDGGTLKSMLSLFVAGRLDQAGARVGLFDWELAAEDHRDRLERLFGENLPGIRYARCIRPLFYEVDRLRRIVVDHQLDYVILDSVAFACDGPPEAAEVAGRYFQAVRQIGPVGSLHVAHISKAEGADQKPFGSVFWHNGARATWFAKVAETVPDGKRMTLGLYNRKSNLGALRSPVAFEITFGDERTTFRRADVADSPDLAAHMSIRQRMAHALRRGSMAPEAVADEIQADADTVKRTARRYRNLFTVLPGGKLGLAERQS